jgi:uncharacterized protein (DUF1697 family)
VETYVALLRSMTVSGRTLATADLERVIGGLGFTDVRGHGEGGNILFGAEEGGTLAHAAAIETAVERDLGPRVGVLVLTAGELARVAAADPFLDDLEVDRRSLHVVMLFPPDEDFGAVSEAAAAAAYEAAFDRLKPPAAAGERAAFVGPPAVSRAVVYLCLPNGVESTELSRFYFERSLGTAAAMRDWLSLRELLELAGGGSAAEAA